MTNLSNIIKFAEDELSNDFEKEGETHYYISEWKDEIFGYIFSEQEFNDFISDTDSKLTLERRILKKLTLVRVGLYIDTSDEFLVLDYAFGKDFDKGFRDSILAVKINSDYKLDCIVMEG